ncbi:MAG: hypothetical protein Q9174_006267, partial [Haloplaca sp. 1 TL-2023]
MSGPTSPARDSGNESTGDDMIDSFELPARIEPSFVEHSYRFNDVSRGIRNAVCVERWSRKGELGRGGFGTVYLEFEEKGSVRAVKELAKHTGRIKTIEVLREVLAMANFSKEEACFVKLLGWYQTKAHIYIAMEYFPEGDLYSQVEQPILEAEVQRISRQLLEGLEFMHRKNYTHRDLKPANIFVVTPGPHWWVKIGDFGVSKRVKNDATTMHTSIDTDFTAPEILGLVGDEYDMSCYTSAVDLWSLGLVAHWLLTQRFPLRRHELRAYCMEKLQLPMTHLDQQHCSKECGDFIRALLHPQPKDRMTAGNALKHGWPQATMLEASNPHSSIGSYQDVGRSTAHCVEELSRNLEKTTLEGSSKANDRKPPAPGPGSSPDHGPTSETAFPVSPYYGELPQFHLPASGPGSSLDHGPTFETAFPVPPYRGELPQFNPPLHTQYDAISQVPDIIPPSLGATRIQQNPIDHRKDSYDSVLQSFSNEASAQSQTRSAQERPGPDVFNWPSMNHANLPCTGREEMCDCKTYSVDLKFMSYRDAIPNPFSRMSDTGPALPIISADFAVDGHARQSTVNISHLRSLSDKGRPLVVHRSSWLNVRFLVTWEWGLPPMAYTANYSMKEVFDVFDHQII